MEKRKSNDLLLFVQERSVVPLTVTVNALEEQKTPEISIKGEDYSLKFKFQKNGKVAVRSKFSDRDCKDSRYWVSILEEAILVAVVKNKNSEDLKNLRATHSHDSHLVSGKEDFLRRYPYLRLPEYYNISNCFWLSEDCGIDLLKSFVTGGWYPSFL